MIHKTAVVHPRAQIDATVQVEPYAVIDEGVRVGAHCWVGPHVYLTGQTVIGEHNRFHAGCVIGDAPQDLKYRDEPTGLVIGDYNIFREHVTVHRSNSVAESTTIGSHNLLMAHSHVGHNSQVSDHVIMANGALLGGHVLVEERAFISGNCLVHQFCRVGALSLMQGGSAISKDLPPYTVARGDNGMCGLNTIGLRRAGLGPEERMELKRLYHVLFRGEGLLRELLAEAGARFSSPAASRMIAFVAATRRGIVRDTGREED